MSKILIKTMVDINYENLKEMVLDEIAYYIEERSGIKWNYLTEDTQEEIIENLLQEFSK